jgi:hypothetical protein
MASGLSSIISGAFPAPDAAAYRPQQPMQAGAIGDPVRYFMASMLQNAQDQKMDQGRQEYLEALQGVGQQRQAYAGEMMKQEQEAEKQKGLLAALKGSKLPMAGILQSMGFEGDMSSIQEADTLNRRLMESQITKNNRAPSSGGSKPPRMSVKTTNNLKKPFEFTLQGTNIGDQDIQALQALQQQYSEVEAGSGAALRAEGEVAREQPAQPAQTMSNRGRVRIGDQLVEGNIEQGVDAQGNPVTVIVTPEGERLPVRAKQ